MKTIDNTKYNIDNALILFFKNNNLEYINKKFILCISTGIDSSVLLDLFINFKEKHKIDFIVAHCNHHRRTQSEEEEIYIKTFCEERNIKIYIKELFFDEDTDNFQAIAREKRYEFFDEVMKKEKADYLVLAHHGDDALETVLMRLTRGSSLKGYSGISDVIINRNYKIIRPLLSYSKEDIIKYQNMHKIKYYEDESNSHKDYTRNRFRLDIIPLLKKECPDILMKIKEYSICLRNAGNEIDSLRDNFIESYVTRCEEKIVINRKEFLLLSNFLQEEVLFELVKKDKLSKANINQLLNIIRSDKVNYINYFKNIFDFIIEYDKIIVNYQHNEKKEIDLIIDKLGHYVINDKFELYVLKKDDNQVLKKEDVCYNINNLPLRVRLRRPGDKIKLKAGEKKIKDLFIDLKMPLEKRNEALILEKDGLVLAVLGVRKSVYLKDSFNSDIIIRLIHKDL